MDTLEERVEDLEEAVDAMLDLLTTMQKTNERLVNTVETLFDIVKRLG